MGEVFFVGFLCEGGWIILEDVLIDLVIVIFVELIFFVVYNVIICY